MVVFQRFSKAMAAFSVFGTAAIASARTEIDPGGATLLSDQPSAEQKLPPTVENDETNSSPRERGRILQKRNPIASEYQVFGDLGTTPGADADGEGVDYRSFFPAGDLFFGPNQSLTAGLDLNYNSLSEKAKPGATVRLQRKFRQDESLAFAFQANSSASSRIIEHHESTWKEAEFEADTDASFFFLDRPRFSFDDIKTRNNVASWQLAKAVSERVTLYYNGYFQGYSDHSYRNRLEAQVGNGDFVYTEDLRIEDRTLLEGTFVNAGTRRYLGDTTNGRDRQRHTIGIHFRGEVWSIDASAYIHSWDITQLWYNWNFNDFGVDLRYRIDNPNFPEVEALNFDLASNETARFTSLRVHDELTRDRDRAGRIDAEREIDLLGNTVWLEMGLHHREKARASYEGRSVYDFNADNPFVLKDVATEDPSRRIVENTYLLQQGLDPLKGRARLDQQPDQFVFNDYQSRIESEPTSYDAEEKVTSTYALGATRLGNASFELGARFQSAKTRTRGTTIVPESVNNPSEGVLLDTIENPKSGNLTLIKDLFAENSYTNFLPSAEIGYTISDHHRLKASWYQALMRPQYFDIVNYRRISVPTRTITEGNPNLSPTELSKYRIAWIGESDYLGFLSAEVYQIDVSNFFYGAVSNENIIEDGSSVEYTVGRVENGDKGTISGFETQWVKVFENLGAIQAPSLRIAYTYSDSESTFLTRPGESLPMPERSEHLAKASLGGQLGPLAAKLNFAYQSEALDDVGDIAARDEYRERVVSLGLDLSYQVNPKLSALLEVANLTNHPEIAYEGSVLRKQRNQYSSWYAILSVERAF